MHVGTCDPFKDETCNDHTNGECKQRFILDIVNDCQIYNRYDYIDKHMYTSVNFQENHSKLLSWLPHIDKLISRFGQAGWEVRQLLSKSKFVAQEFPR